MSNVLVNSECISKEGGIGWKQDGGVKLKDSEHLNRS
jgi:hypothetical protein